MVLGSLYFSGNPHWENSKSPPRWLKRDRQAWGGHAWRSSGREYHQMLCWHGGDAPSIAFLVGTPILLMS